MAGLAATYVDLDTFTVSGDLTTTFKVGRRVKCNCGVDGYKFGTIASNSFGGGVTTVNLTAASDDLTSNLTEVWYGIVAEGTDGSVPLHTHDGAEGSGGEVTDDDAIHDNVNGEINAITSKTTPANNDIIVIEDSAASYAKKKILASTLKVINVNDEGSPITGTPHTTLNFVGNQVVASNAGGGVANITIIPRPIIQVTRKNITTTVQTTTIIDYSTTPTSSDGTAFDNLSITMTGANTVRVQCLIPFDANDDNAGAVALVYRGTTVLAVASSMVGKKEKVGSQLMFDFYDTPGTGTITYYIRVGTFAGKTLSYNRLAPDATPWGGTLYTNNCNITLTELVLT